MSGPKTPNKGDKRLFELCVVTFAPSHELSPSMVTTLKDTIKTYGGTILETNDDGSLPLVDCTHIVATSIDFPQYNEAMSMMLPVVKPSWISSSIQKGRQAAIRPYNPDPRLIFSGVVLTCEGLPPTDKEAIIGAVVGMGGSESKDYGRTTTHICALSTEGEKAQMALSRSSSKCKVVLPHWFDDCFRLGKRIDEGPYLLPDPEIIRLDAEHAVNLPPPSQHLNGATSDWPDRPPQLQHGSRQKLTVFKNRKIALSWDLDLTERLRKILESLITDGGGQIVTAEQCDWFVCKFRDGPAYVRAAQEAKIVGSLAWLYYVIINNQYTDPLRRLLHYPVPKEGIEGFKGLRVTVSNYGGEARQYLQNLLKAAGAEVTGSMRPENTHLVTARNAGDKCEAAADWNLPMVNHLWVEESYAKCEVQALTNPRYTHFPPRTNLGEIIGQTWLDEEQLHAIYYPGGDDSAEARRKRRMHDLIRENAQVRGPAAGLVVGRQKHPEFDIMKDDEATYAEKTAKKFGVPAPPKTKAQEAATPIRPRQLVAGKENDTSSVLSSGSRSAKATALSKLHNLASDIELYEKEKKRKSTGNTPFGGKRAAHLYEQEREKEKEQKARQKTRSASPSQDLSEADGDEQPPTKKQKTSMPAVDMRIVLTGYQRWTDNAKLEDKDKRKLRLMGIQIVQEDQACNYLAAPTILRTLKFLRALAKAPDVINSKFIDDCLELGERPDVKDYKLQDKEKEKEAGIKLEDSVKNARRNKGRLLWGVPIYCTTQIKKGVHSFKGIAEANGAIFKTYTGRSVTIKVVRPEEDSQGPEPVYLLTSDSKAERDLWPKFEKMARDGNMEPRVVSGEWLLKVAMRQQLTFDKKKDLAVNVFKN